MKGGAHVSIASSNRKRVDDAIARLVASNPQAKERIAGFTVDVGSLDSLEDNVLALLKAVPGPLHHIVSTAGTFPPAKPIADHTTQSIIESGVSRFFLGLILGKLAPKYMLQTADGKVLQQCSLTFTSGALADRPAPGMAPLTAFGCGMIGVVRGLAVELAPLRINAIFPGPIDTEMFSVFKEEERKAFTEKVASRTLLQRLGRPEETAEAYLYVLKDSFVTGETINTNGGYLLT